MTLTALFYVFVLVTVLLVVFVVQQFRLRRRIAAHKRERDLDTENPERNTGK